MYTLNPCRCPGCIKSAISTIDADGNLQEMTGFCLEHHPNPQEAITAIKKYILEHDKIVGVNACGITVSGIDLGSKKFIGCNFQGCTFTNVHSNGLRARMCMFDSSTFTDCDFLNSNIQYTSMAGSKFVHVILTGSDLIHNNFNGVTAYQSSFDGSDLYNSRFIKATLMNTSLSDCNLKKTVFYDSVREGVSFKLSNTKEALIDRSKGGMMGDKQVRESEDSDSEGGEE